MIRYLHNNKTGKIFKVPKRLKKIYFTINHGSEIFIDIKKDLV